MGKIRHDCKCVARLHQGKDRFLAIAKEDLAGFPTSKHLILDGKQMGGNAWGAAYGNLSPLFELLQG